MPIELATPIEQPAITRMEVVDFHADLRAMTVRVVFAHYDAAGELVKDDAASFPLVDPTTGQPNFQLEEYVSIKGVLYRLAAQYGYVVGTVL